MPQEHGYPQSQPPNDIPPPLAHANLFFSDPEDRVDSPPTPGTPSFTPAPGQGGERRPSFTPRHQPKRSPVPTFTPHLASPGPIDVIPEQGSARGSNLEISYDDATILPTAPPIDWDDPKEQGSEGKPSDSSLNASRHPVASHQSRRPVFVPHPTAQPASPPAAELLRPSDVASDQAINVDRFPGVDGETLQTLERIAGSLYSFVYQGKTRRGTEIGAGNLSTLKVQSEGFTMLPSPSNPETPLLGMLHLKKGPLGVVADGIRHAIPVSFAGQVQPNGLLKPGDNHFLMSMPTGRKTPAGIETTAVVFSRAGSDRGDDPRGRTETLQSFAYELSVDDATTLQDLVVDNPAVFPAFLQLASPGLETDDSLSVIVVDLSELDRSIDLAIDHASSSYISLDIGAWRRAMSNRREYALAA